MPPSAPLFPVGRELFAHDMAQLTDAQVERRRIYDPRYAGFEPSFNWRQHVRVELSDPVLRDQVEASLDQFARTELGQHTLRQAHAMQAYRDGAGVLTSAQLTSRSRITITDGAENENRFDPSSGRLLLHRESIVAVEMLRQNGRYSDASVQGTLFHELCHAGDGFLTPQNQQAYRDSRLQRDLRLERDLDMAWDSLSPQAWQARATAVEEKTHYAAAEYAVIDATNQFMHRYYNEPERALQASAVYFDPPMLHWQTPRELGADHFYDEINAPPMPRGHNPQQR